MFGRRFRRCTCMNNSQEYEQENLESKCQNLNTNCCDYTEDDYGCGFDDEEEDVFPSNPMLAQSYVPIQFMDRTFKPEVGLRKGTIFPELVSPYRPGQSMEEIEFLERRNNSVGGMN